MYCTCGQHKAGGYTAAQALDAEPHDFNYDFWVCSNCKKPTRLVFEKVTHMYAPKSATALLSIRKDQTGRAMLTWAGTESGSRIQTMTFHPYPRKVDMADDGRDICVELWRRLDACIDQIRGVQVDAQLIEFEKIRAQQLADVIVLVMSPFYADQTAVLKESMTRWTARQESREHESPGLAETIWHPNTRFDGTPYSEENEKKVRNSGARTTKPPAQLDEQKVTFINHCLQNGTMDIKTLAGMFNCSEDDIKAVVK